MTFTKVTAKYPCRPHLAKLAFTDQPLEIEVVETKVLRLGGSGGMVVRVHDCTLSRRRRACPAEIDSAQSSPNLAQTFNSVSPPEASPVATQGLPSGQADIAAIAAQLVDYENKVAVGF